jgi:hypothetical protein
MNKKCAVGGGNPPPKENATPPKSVPKPKPKAKK